MVPLLYFKSRTSDSILGSVRPSVGPSFRPLVRPSVHRSPVFFNRGIQAKKQSNLHQCACPTFATDAAVYTALFKIGLDLTPEGVPFFIVGDFGNDDSPFVLYYSTVNH